MTFTIPRPLKVEHDELHQELVSATKEPGSVGEAARRVAGLLHPHFVKEEEYALPPLGLLAEVAQGRITPDMKAVLALTDRLKADLPEMLKEHGAIVDALDGLSRAAREAGKPRYAHFAEKLILHAQTEEQVMYPAALAVGALVRQALERS